MTKPTKHKTIELSQDAYILVTTDKETHLLQANGAYLKYSIEDFYEGSIRRRLKHGTLTNKETLLLEQIKTELLDLVGDNI